MPSGIERVLFVHAHPDDESISTGGTIATLIDRGAAVTVLTCTRGERGEVIPASLAHLEGDGPALAAHREGELAAAMRELGVTDHRYLGAADARWPGNVPRKYLDSGMRWGSSGAEALDTTDDGSFTAAVFGEAAADIAAVISDVRPHVVVSYDANGGYGHPDHIQAHRTARRAAEVLGVPFWVIARGTVTGSIVVDVSAVLARKSRALEAHATQVLVTGESFTLSGGESAPIAREEAFALLRPQAEPTGAFRELSRFSQVLAVIAAAVLGGVTGLVMTAAHQATLVVGSLVVPWGLVVAMLSVGALIVGLRLAFDTRVLPIAAVVPLLLVVTFLAAPTVGGSIAMPANPAGYIWTFWPTLVILAVLVWPGVHRRRAGNIGLLPAPKGSLIP